MEEYEVECNVIYECIFPFTYWYGERVKILYFFNRKGDMKQMVKFYLLKYDNETIDYNQENTISLDFFTEWFKPINNI